MKHVTRIIALIGIASSVHAQQTAPIVATKTTTWAGRWVIGVETDNLLGQKKAMNSGNDYYRRKLMPTVGYFVTNTLVLGLGAPLGSSPQPGTYYSDGTIGQVGVYSTSISPQQIGVSPFVQQFIGKGKLKPYVGAAYRYTYQQLGFRIRHLSVHLRQSGNESELSVFTGLTCLITPKFGIDAKLRYGWQSGNHPYLSFPNRLESGYSSTFAFTGQTASANVGLRLLLGR